ncbi:13609_t:CDS:2 [Dentiscutata erythropus]|uniref:13609_t:CDS:1 n=1 Tax=Dentiscutata erythropus TaxID=1348616 RepID=A0A9N9IXV8_9GLOM|nr:13609_t:CDS:2 [Dentiscutata erythropus]
MENLDQDSISLRPVYNLIELGLEEYKDNELVLDTVHDLMQFFEQSNCTSMQEHLKNEGITERIHGNTGHVPKIKSKVFLNFSITFLVKHFLEQYGTINGLPSPIRHKNESEPFIYLSTGSTYVSVYDEFKKYFYNENNQDEKIISYFTFRKL